MEKSHGYAQKPRYLMNQRSQSGCRNQHMIGFPALSGSIILEPLRWPAGSNVIVLTFDDGPSPRVSNALLDILVKHQVTATFCYIGSNIDRYPEIAARAVKEGHTIALHTHEHRMQSILSADKLRAENTQTLSVLNAISGIPPREIRLFRPPLGLKTPAVRKVMKDSGLSYAYLTFFVNDAKVERDECRGFMEEIKQKLMKYEGGAIVLHEMRYRFGSENTAICKDWLPEAVDELIVWAKGNGFRFGTYPSELSEQSAAMG